MPALFRGNYIGGRFLRPSKGTELISEDPGDLLEPVGSLIVSEEPVDQAVVAAAKAFPSWSALPLQRRIAKLRLFQRFLKERQSSLIRLVAREAGKPLAESQREVERLAGKVDEMVMLGLKLIRPFRVAVGQGVFGECRYRPLGVLAVIGPFNFPAHTPGSHIIPALLTGNTVVFKPSEYTPFVGQGLAECLDAAGLPAGVFNLVQGDSRVGERLVGHPQVAGILFTGSTAVGTAIKLATLKEPQKSLALEMGGKNGALVLGDADLELAAREIATAAYSMAGQRCNATSRVIVDRRVAKRFLARFLEAVERVTIGYPLDEGVLMGPLVSHDAVAKFQRYMKLAEEEGFETLRPGRALGVWQKRRGYYVIPAAHLCEKPAKNRSLHYRREEIFGPDVAIYLVKGEEEAVAINNEVPYGLVTSVFTRSRPRFERLFGRIDTGMVNLNRGTIFSSGKLPFGGTKASGSFKPAGLFSPYYCTTPVALLEDRRPISQRPLPV
ncbi:MAG: aldehyde dehydrogenase family protein [Candidatus Omnitrophica bacterium]|nr:aldehyde dehydrogenase family protein [Candidatus Omnitrophota bacterium]